MRRNSRRRGHDSGEGCSADVTAPTRQAEDMAKNTGTGSAGRTRPAADLPEAGDGDDMPTAAPVAQTIRNCGKASDADVIDRRCVEPT